MATKEENRELLQRIEDRSNQLLGLVNGIICIGMTSMSQNGTGYVGPEFSNSLECLGILAGEVHKEIDESVTELFKNI